MQEQPPDWSIQEWSYTARPRGNARHTHLLFNKNYLSPPMTKLGRKRVVALVILLFSAVVTLIMAAVFEDIVDQVIEEELHDKLPITNGSYAFGFWKSPPVPVRFGVHVFDIVNPEEVKKGEEVPTVIDKGPYVYEVRLEKKDIEWHDNFTVSYVQPQRFTFNRELSVGPDTETFTTLNVPYLTMATILQYEFKWLQRLVDAFMRGNHEEAFVTKSVHDIWWGYEDPVLEEVAHTLHKYNISNPMLNGKFGFFMDRNNTDDGRYVVFDGLDGDYSKYITISRWNGLEKLDNWKSDYANEIRGTDGSMYPPRITSDTKLSMFDSNLKRSVNLEYHGSSSFDGVDTIHFKIPFSDFANPKENPKNVGFCTPDASHCLPSGAYNLSESAYYAPMYVSMPHFVGGDSYYQHLVRGMDPDPARHQPFFDIHALTGVCLQAARRYQINLRTQDFEHFSAFKGFPVAYVPVLWIDGVAQVDDSTASLFRDEIQAAMDALPKIRAGLFGMSALLLVIAAGIVLHWRRQKKSTLYKYEVLDDENKPLKRKKNKRKGSTTSNQSGQKASEEPGISNQANGVAGSQPFIPPEVDAMNPEADDGNLLPTASFDGPSHYYDPQTAPSPETTETYKSFRDVQYS